MRLLKTWRRHAAALVLPLPEGPSSAIHLAGRNAERDALENLIVAEPQLEILDDEINHAGASEPDRDGKAGADHDHVDDGKGGHRPTAPVPHSDTSSEPITSVPGPSR